MTAPLPLVDTHAHLQFDAFDDDRDATLQRAREAGLLAIVNVGTGLESSAAAIDLAERHDWLYATAGVHPHDAESLHRSDPYLLRAYAMHSRTVALGETGLDYHRMLSSREAQIAVFRAHLIIAADLGLPVVVHSREAADDTWAVLSEWAGGLGREERDSRILGVMHCFDGDAALALRYVALGFVISIPGPVTYPKAGQRREVARQVPLEALVAETDCPYLAPQSHRGRRNEPAYLVETVRCIAELRGETPARVARATAENAARLFRLPLAAIASATSTEERT